MENKDLITDESIGSSYCQVMNPLIYFTMHRESKRSELASHELRSDPTVLASNLEYCHGVCLWSPCSGPMEAASLTASSKHTQTTAYPTGALAGNEVVAEYSLEHSFVITSFKGLSRILLRMGPLNSSGSSRTYPKFTRPP